MSPRSGYLVRSGINNVTVCAAGPELRAVCASGTIRASSAVSSAAGAISPQRQLHKQAKTAHRLIRVGIGSTSGNKEFETLPRPDFHRPAVIDRGSEPP